MLNRARRADKEDSFATDNCFDLVLCASLDRILTQPSKTTIQDNSNPRMTRIFLHLYDIVKTHGRRDEQILLRVAGSQVQPIGVTNPSMTGIKYQHERAQILFEHLFN